jgi:RNA polymerase sigma factor (sigma-70 family)
MTDNELVKNIKSLACDNSFKELVDRHSPLFNSIFQRYAARLKERGVGHTDFFREKEYIFFQAINLFDESKGVKFSTWLANCVRYHCLISLWNLSKYTIVDPEELEFYEQNKGNMDSLFQNTDIHDILFRAINTINDESTKKIFLLRYFKNQKKKMPWREVSAEMGMSIRSCVTLHKRTLPYLKSKLLKIDYQVSVDNQ